MTESEEEFLSVIDKKVMKFPSVFNIKLATAYTRDQIFFP